MKLVDIHVQWADRGRDKEVFSRGENIDREGLYIKLCYEQLPLGRILRLKAASDKRITFKKICIDMEADMKDSKVMSNGYQTWTQSTEMDAAGRIKGLNPVVFNLLKGYSDYGFIKYTGKSGRIYSWTYTYIKKPWGDTISFAGSCSEGTGYTIFDIDISRNSVKVIKDCEGMDFQGEGEIMSLYMGEGSERSLFDEYFFSALKVNKPSKRYTGWTSWYNYYTSISEEIVLHNLNSLSDRKIPMDVFQVDDGYQHAVGDWLEVNGKFPSGMKKIADEVKRYGYKPGLWLAPFVCEKKSHVFMEHPDWLLKDREGRLVKAGWNPGWSGTFYSLDFYNKEYREYLNEVFRTIFYEWGYELVKLDFLYGVCIIPHNGKSRGQIMSEAMDFIREIAGENKILGCGIPLGPVFGKIDYCRIGSDVAPYWEDNKLTFLNYHERVSTVNSLISTIGRYQLDGRAFNNDPDVFMLREDKIKLSEDEKYTLFVLNNIFGGLVFFSDDVASYSDKEMNLLRSMYPRVNPVIKNVENCSGLYKIELSLERKEYVIYSNLGVKNSKIELEDIYFNSESLTIQDRGTIILKPHNTVVLMRIDNTSGPYLIGAKGHLLPGGQIADFSFDGDGLKIVCSENSSPETEIYIGVDKSVKCLKINGEIYDAAGMGDYGLIVVNNENLNNAGIPAK